jgi:hypothetical protein
MTVTAQISGCASPPKKVEYVYVPLPLERPERPIFTNVSKSQLMCVSSDTLQSLKMRDDMMKTYMNRLESIIDGTKIIQDQ